MFRGGAQQEEIAKHWISTYETANPDVEIEWLISPSGWQTSLPVWVASGTGPDIIEMWGAEARDWGEQGVLLDLNPYVNRDFTKEDRNDFFPISWQVGVVNYGPKKGVRFGLPAYGNIYTIYYNKQAFAEAGVPPIPDLDRSGEWTWDGLIKYGKKLNKWSGEQIVRYALVDNALQHPTARGAGWIAANGGKVFDLPENPTKFMMDMPETIEALQYLQDLIWEHRIVPPIPEQGKFGFATGLCAMTMEGTGMMSRYLAQIGNSFDIDLARRPMGKAGRGYYLASDMFGLSAATKNPEASWHFLNYLVSKEAAEAYARIMSRGPVRRSAFAAYQKEYAGYSIQIYAEGMADSVISPETQMYKVTEARNNLIWKAVRDQVVPNKKTAKQAISEIADAVRALYK